MGAKVIQVIETDLERRGSGKDETSPIRIIRQYWSLDGELLAEVDPFVVDRPTPSIMRGVQRGKAASLTPEGRDEVRVAIDVILKLSDQRNAKLGLALEQLDKAAAEIEKLRAALKEIDAMDRCMHPLCRSTQAAQIARDALRACEQKAGAAVEPLGLEQKEGNLNG